MVEGGGVLSMRNTVLLEKSIPSFVIRSGRELSSAETLMAGTEKKSCPLCPSVDANSLAAGEGGGCCSQPLFMDRGEGGGSCPCDKVGSIYIDGKN